jgi:hypothetical protein
MQEHRLYVDVYFTSIISSKRIAQTKFKLRFIDVIRYDLLWDVTYYFYNVERYKLLKTDIGFYISLDPVDETDTPGEHDGDVIISKSIEGYLID